MAAIIFVLHKTRLCTAVGLMFAWCQIGCFAPVRGCWTSLDRAICSCHQLLLMLACAFLHNDFFFGWQQPVGWPIISLICAPLACAFWLNMHIAGFIAADSDWLAQKHSKHNIFGWLSSCNPSFCVFRRQSGSQFSGAVLQQACATSIPTSSSAAAAKDASRTSLKPHSTFGMLAICLALGFLLLPPSPPHGLGSRWLQAQNLLCAFGNHR